MEEELAKNITAYYDTIINWLSNHLVNVGLIIIATFLIRHFSHKIVFRILSHTMRNDYYRTETDRKKRLKTLSSLFSATIDFGSIIIAIVLIITEFGINTGPLIAGAGFFGAALGFGAQGLVKDFISGIFIIMENQYRVGDVVEIGNVSGTVESISIRTTVLRDLDGHVHHVPNGSITVTTNKTMDYGNINEDLEVGFNTDIPKLEKIINGVGQKLSEDPELAKYIRQAPRFSSIKGFTNNGLVVKVLGRTTPDDKWKVKSEFFRLLQKELTKSSINIAHQLVTVDSDDTKKP